MKLFSTRLPQLICIIFLTTCSHSALSQDHAARFAQAGKLFAAGEIEKALQIVNELDESGTVDDDLKKDIRWARLGAFSALAKQARNKLEWAAAQKHTKQVLDILEKSNGEFTGDFFKQLENRKFFAYKNMILACNGLDELEDAQTYKDRLYRAFRQKRLPKGLDEYFNFEFDRVNKLNVWGYEYFSTKSEPNSDDESPKYVYHVYSTNEDGTDKTPAFLLVLVEIPKINKDDKTVFALSKRWMVDGEEQRKTLYNQTYTDPVNLKKLRTDVRKLVKEFSEPKNKSADKN